MSLSGSSYSLEQEIVVVPAAALRACSLVQALGRRVVQGGEPLEMMHPPIAGSGGASLDQRQADPFPAMALGDEQVVHERRLGGVGRAERPVQRGEPDQLVAPPGAKQEAIIARSQEPTEELSVSVLVGLGQIEALVSGDERQDPFVVGFRQGLDADAHDLTRPPLGSNSGSSATLATHPSARERPPLS